MQVQKNNSSQKHALIVSDGAQQENIRTNGSDMLLRASREELQKCDVSMR
jgi:hypothetical protein